MRSTSTTAAPSGAAGLGVPGTVYLLCFGAGGLHVTGNRYARHYIGWTAGPVQTRVDMHTAGEGSPLVRAAVLAGLSVELVRTWAGVDRHFERALKRRKEAPLLCPTCCERAGRTPYNPAAPGA